MVCHTIKRGANLVGLRKIECSSIKTKSKERHSRTSLALRNIQGAPVVPTFLVGGIGRSKLSPSHRLEVARK